MKRLIFCQQRHFFIAYSGIFPFGQNDMMLSRYFLEVNNFRVGMVSQAGAFAQFSNALKEVYHREGVL
jgi:hypothetical protein